MEEKARSGDGHGQEEAGFRDGETEGELGQRRGRRRLQQAPGPQLRRREDHAAVEKTQAGLCAVAAHVRERQLVNLPSFFSPIFSLFGGNETNSGGRKVLVVFTQRDVFSLFVFFFLHADGDLCPDNVRRGKNILRLIGEDAT